MDTLGQLAPLLVMQLGPKSQSKPEAQILLQRNGRKHAQIVLDFEITNENIWTKEYYHYARVKNLRKDIINKYKKYLEKRLQKERLSNCLFHFGRKHTIDYY